MQRHTHLTQKELNEITGINPERALLFMKITASILTALCLVVGLINRHTQVLPESGWKIVPIDRQKSYFTKTVYFGECRVSPVQRDGEEFFKLEVLRVEGRDAIATPDLTLCEEAFELLPPYVRSGRI